MFAYCLADFFNLQLWRTGRPPVYSDVRDGLDDLVAAGVSACESASEVTFRLYGGWHGQVPESREALREMTSRAVVALCKRLGRTRVRVELADTPVWDRSLILRDTVRVARLANVPARVERCDECLRPTDCSVPGLGRWFGGKCPEEGCAVKLPQVSWRHQQKMVDTLLTADALAIAHASMCDAVLVASDDADMLPALFALSASDVEVVRMARREPRDEYYEGLLELGGVRTYRW